jgi:hypothetical protein
MTKLRDVLGETQDEWRALWNCTGAMLVFPQPEPDRRYWHLTDYAVSSALSGPSILLVPRAQVRAPLPAAAPGKDGV